MTTLPGAETTLDPNRQVHLGIWRDEHDDTTRRFFRWDVPALSDACLSAMDAGIREDKNSPDLSTIEELLEPGYLPIETGIVRTSEGGLGVAVWTAWPGTTPEMIDWWFGWHLSRTERYKLWHPQAHLFSQPRFDRSDVDGLTDRDRYLGNTSWVDEYVGPFVSRLAITFSDPADLGLPYDSLEASGHGTAVCARVEDSDSGDHLAHLVHAVRRTAWGSEMRSRFVFPPGTPDFIGAPMLDHCYTEMTHLAGFLPQLHAHMTLVGPQGH
jgi:hypothetical protein